MTIDIRTILGRLARYEAFPRTEAQALFEFMVSGEATGPQVGALLMGLRMRGETQEEIIGAAQAMRARMLRVAAPASAIDIVGTGGDGLGTFNISTAASFVVAGAGVTVAKHGNRAVSSKSGAADVLSALGVNVHLGPSGVEKCIAEAGIGFMFAPDHHPALRHVMPARVDLAMRTIFNILGPLLNPAGVRRQLVGVYSSDLVAPIVRALQELGSTSAMVVCGVGGIDEITTCGPTHLGVLANDTIRFLEISPEDVGLPRASLATLKGGSASDNALALRRVLGGERGPYRDVTLFNAAAALLVAGAESSWAGAMSLARRSIDEGRAAQCLDRMVSSSGMPTDTAAGEGTVRETSQT